MGKTLETEISGRKYLINTDESEDYVDQISAAVTSKILEVKNESGASPLDCATMAALSFADELYKELAKKRKTPPQK